MKVIQINCVYNYGSTGKMVKDIHFSLEEQGIESIVLYGRGKQSCDKNVYKISNDFRSKMHSLFARLFGVDMGFSFISTAKTIHIIKKEKPDVVHLQCLDGHFINAYRLTKFLKKSKIKTVLTLHAENMHTAGCVHAIDCNKWKTQCHNCPIIRGKVSHFFRDDAKHCFKKMQKAFAGFENLTVVGVSNWLTERAACSPIFSGCHFETVHNAIDTDIFKYTPSDIKHQLGIKNSDKMVLFVASLFNHYLKGSKFALEAAKRLPQYKFVMIGQGAENVENADNILAFSHTTSREELAKLYSAADITLLTSVRETFSIVVAESLCCGTPVVGFKSGGPESVFKENVVFCDNGNMDTLVKEIENALQSSPDDKTSISQANRSLFNAKAMTDSYISLYK